MRSLGLWILISIACGSLAVSASRTTYAAPAEPPAVTAQEVAVLDGDTGRLLWGRHETVHVHPASLTKMVTALVALDHEPLDAKVIVDVESADMRFSTIMGLHPGMMLTMQDLLYGLLLPSGNDAALAIGRFVSGDDASFVALMNQKAQDLEARQSHFSNPHGLDADDHLSTALDLAVLARAAMQNETFATIASSRYWSIPEEGLELFNLNRLLGYYPGADGVKVGYTRRSGPALAASATRNGSRMIVVVLHSVDPPTDSARLLDWAFAQKRATLSPEE